MAFDYADLAATVDELLAEFGALAKLELLPAIDYNVATGTADRARKAYDVQAARMSYKLSEIDGTNVLRGDARFIVSAIGIPKPTVGARLLFAGEAYGVVDVDELAPAGTAVRYVLQGRK